jgi:hypothetical protein
MPPEGVLALPCCRKLIHDIKYRSRHSFCRLGQHAEPLGESWSSCGIRWQLGHGRGSALDMFVEQTSVFAKSLELFHRLAAPLQSLSSASGERQLRRCRFGAESEEHATCDILPTRNKPGMRCLQAYRVLLSGYLHIGVKGKYACYDAFAMEKGRGRTI